MGFSTNQPSMPNPYTGSTENKIEMAIYQIAEARLTTLFGISRDELYEMDDDGQYIYNDEFDATSNDVRTALNNLQWTLYSDEEAK